MPFHTATLRTTDVQAPLRTRVTVALPDIDRSLIDQRGLFLLKSSRLPLPHLESASPLSRPKIQAVAKQVGELWLEKLTPVER
jgi:hypothetical protein